MTENEKILINNERTTKQVTLVFPNHEINDIDNTQVYQESFDLEESLFDGESLTFGKCNASLFKIRVADFTEDIKDAEMDVYVTFTNPDTAITSLTVPFGKYTVQSVERTSDRRWRDITAVDFMSKFDADIADWYNTTLYPTSATTHTISEIRTALCQRIGVTQASVTLINDSLTISKAVEPSTLSARELLQYICEINGVFGHFDWSGTLQYISLEVTHGLYPSVTLFPSTNLFPRRATTTSGVQNENVETFRECDYEDYDVERIDSVAIVKEDGNVGVYYNINPTYKNRYNVVGNILLYEFDTTQLQTIAQTICNKISDCAFRPNKTVMYSGIYMPLGQPYSVNSRLVNEDNVINNTFNSVLLKRTISGIQAMFSTLEAVSSQYQPDISATDVLSDIKISKGKFSKFEHDLEHFQSELTDYETETNTKIVQTSEHILQTAAKNINDWDSENYNIKWENYDTPNKLMVGVSETQPIVGDYFLNVSNGKLYTLATVSKDTTLSDSNYNYYNVTYTYVKDLDSIQTTLSSQIEQTAESITSTVAKTQTVWLEEHPVGTPVNIKYKSYGNPEEDINVETTPYPNATINDLYLNVNTGMVYSLSDITTISETEFEYTWDYEYTLISQKSDMQSKIVQTAESITSTIAQSQTSWLEEYPLGTKITIKYKDYGDPPNGVSTDEFEEMDFRDGDYYLDVNNGKVYSGAVSGSTIGRVALRWTLVTTLNKTNEYFSSSIEQTAQSITSRVSSAQSTWIEEHPVGTPVTIKYRGYEAPQQYDNQNVLYPNAAINDLYLNMNDGKVYKITNIEDEVIIVQPRVAKVVKKYTWTYQYDLTAEIDEVYSEIEQLPHTISMKVNSVEGGSGELGKNTSVGITITLLDEDGNIVDSGEGTITLNGNVIFTSNLTDGQTTISGSNITTGVINANLITAGTMSCDRLNGGTISGQTISGGTMAGTEVYCTNTLYMPSVLGKTPVMSVYEEGVVSPNRLNIGNASLGGGTHIYGDSVNGIELLANTTVQGSISATKVYIGSSTIQSVSANCYVGGNNGLNKITGSSIKYKHDFKREFNEDLDPHKLYDVPIYQFKFQTNHLDNEKDIRYDKAVIGFITESLAKHYPIACDYEYDRKTENYKALGWNEKYMIPPMLSLIQEQHKEIESLKDELATLKEQVAFLMQGGQVNG